MTEGQGATLGLFRGGEPVHHGGANGAVSQEKGMGMKGRTLSAAGFALCAFSAVSLAAEIRVQNPVPFSETAVIASNIKAECNIGAQLAESLKRESLVFGNEIVLGADVPDTAQGQVLKLEIVDAQSGGNAFIGHHKAASVRGELFKDGAKVASFAARRGSQRPTVPDRFAARRTSMGGFGGGFKGSCAVLNRTVNAIGQDVAKWLSSPVDGAQLGNL